MQIPDAPWIRSCEATGYPDEYSIPSAVCRCKSCNDDIQEGDTYYKRMLSDDTVCEYCFKDYLVELALGIKGDWTKEIAEIERPD